MKEIEYTIQQMAKLAHISTRTLRYYDQIELLPPLYINASGYRIYGEKEVDALQQILFYKELSLELSEISSILHDSSFESLPALKSHLQKLLERKNQLSLLITNVKKTILKEEGKQTMTNQEKFKGFKEELLGENEEKYGEEIRNAYGEEAVTKSNDKMMNLTEEEYSQMQQLGEEIGKRLETAVQAGEKPEGEEGQKIAKLHQEWLTFTWPKYSKEAHMGLVELYVADERFTTYYDGNEKGCAAFLREAVQVMCR